MVKHGWGFQINYDQAIAEDEARIAWAERSIARGWYRRLLPNVSHEFEIQHLWQLVLYFRDVATTAEYSPQDVDDLSAYVDEDIWKLFPDLPPEQPGRAGHDRGKAILAELHKLSEGDSWLHKDEPDARADLRKAKASRARHKTQSRDVRTHISTSLRTCLSKQPPRKDRTSEPHTYTAEPASVSLARMQEVV